MPRRAVYRLKGRRNPHQFNFIAAVGLLTFSPVKLLGVLPALLLLAVALFMRGGTGMGGGDIKLTAASGFTLGLPAISAGLILGMGAAFLIPKAVKAKKRGRYASI